MLRKELGLKIVEVGSDTAVVEGGDVLWTGPAMFFLQCCCFFAKILGSITFAGYNVRCNRSVVHLSARLSHSCTLLKPLDKKRCHLAVHSCGLALKLPVRQINHYTGLWSLLGKGKFGVRSRNPQSKLTLQVGMRLAAMPL